MRRALIAIGLLLAAASLLLAGWLAVDGQETLEQDPGPRAPPAVLTHGTGDALSEDETAPPTLGGGGVAPDSNALAEDECGVLGRVLDARTGEPVAGARVLALLWFDGHDAYPYGQSVSDADGRYRVRGVEGAMTCLRLIACGGGWISAVAVPSPACGAMDICTVALAPGVWAKHDLRVLPGAAAQGTVHLPDGRPAAGATVHPERFYVDDRSHECFPWDGIPPTTCDAEGRFAFDGLPPAKGLGFVAALEGYVDATSEGLALAVGETRRASIRFEAPRRVVLTVRGEDGAPIDGASVRYMWYRRARFGENRYEATVEDGRLVLPLVPSWPFRLRIDAKGYVPFGSLKREIPADLLTGGSDGTWTGDIVLEDVTYVTGRVERPDGLDGLPLRVGAKALAAPGHEDYGAGGAVAADGTFRVPTPRTGTYRLTVGRWFGRKRYEAEIDVEAGASGVVLRPLLTRSWADPERTGSWARWSITVLGQDGRPVEEAETTILACGMAERAPGSEYRLGPDDAGAVLLDVREDALGAGLLVRVWGTQDGCAAGSSLFGPFGPEGGEVSVRMPARRPITGRLLTPDGTPVQGAHLTVALARPKGAPDDWSSYERLDWTWTDADGHFAFRRLADDDVLIEVESAGSWPPPPALPARAGARDLEIRLLDRVDCRLTILGVGGIPVPGGRVSLRQRDGQRGAEPDHFYDDKTHVEIGRDGVAEVKGLERGGTYELSVHPAGDLRRLEIEDWVPKDDTFHLEPERCVAGRLLDASGRPVEGALVVLRGSHDHVDVVWSEANGGSVSNASRMAGTTFGPSTRVPAS